MARTTTKTCPTCESGTRLVERGDRTLCASCDEVALRAIDTEAGRKMDIAKTLHERIHDNVDAWYAGKKSAEEFRAENRLLWESVVEHGVQEEMAILMRPAALAAPWHEQSTVERETAWLHCRPRKEVRS